MSVQYVAELQIDHGERLHVKSVVKPKCEHYLPFLIRSARYELLNPNGIVEAEGDCSISDHELDVLIEPQKTGTYRLKYIYEIADEIWVDNVRIKVG
ncbi:MAG: hypothetical protein Q4F83_04905 [Eubacteriales bacterium]|nr:hypothetical protein [Eubacteriales bacterium]